MESKIVLKSLPKYLGDLPPHTVADLYQHSAACLAILRELPEVARHYVMRLLFIEHALSMSTVNTWAQLDVKGQRLHASALSSLQTLKVIEYLPLPGGQQGITLSPSFKTNVRALICGGGTPWVFPSRSGDNKHARDVEFLNSYADQQWEGILNYMVSGTSKDITMDTVEILQSAHLMASAVPGPQPEITARGFQFLLLDRASQVWFFVLQYLTQMESRGLNLVDCLTFIFKLSFLNLGKDYSTEDLTDTQSILLQHLRLFGLTYQRKRSSKRYYPTKLAINLVSGSRGGSNSMSSGPQRDGFVLLETNFRVMAYTNSPLQIAILGLFAQLHYRFPNFVVGTVTRDSVHKALMKGITSDQILSFLRLHAHPEMHRNHPLIPPTVSDQVCLWEMERDRLETNEGVLYSDFLSATDFEKVRKYAEDLGVLLWSNPGKRFVVVSNGGHDDVKRFWRRQSKK